MNVGWPACAPMSAPIDPAPIDRATLPLIQENIFYSGYVEACGNSSISRWGWKWAVLHERKMYLMQKPHSMQRYLIFTALITISDFTFIQGGVVER
eukprot:gene25753-biopygen10801